MKNWWNLGGNESFADMLPMWWCCRSDEWMKLPKTDARYNTGGWGWLMVMWQGSWQLPPRKRSDVLIAKKILKYYWHLWALPARWRRSNARTTLGQSSSNWSLGFHVLSLFSCHQTFIFTDSSWNLLVSKISSTWWSFIPSTISGGGAGTSQLNGSGWYCSRWIIEMTGWIPANWYDRSRW